MNSDGLNETHTPSPAEPPRRGRLARAWLRTRNRTIDLATNTNVRVIALILVVAVLGTVGYAWLATSRMIDRHLSGDIFESRSGVYASPLLVRVGQPASQSDLVKYLQELGYGAGDAGDAGGFSGRYTLDGPTLVIEPQNPEVVAAGQFVPVSITFGEGGGGIRAISSPGSHETLPETYLEPLLLSSVGNTREKRILVEYDAVPATLRSAIVTTEDRRFWKHHGVDYRGIARAVRQNFGEGGVVEGGSTLTQQLVKNVFLTPERTYTRKIKEAWVSFVLETKLSKQQIFALYANEIYLGQSGTFAIHGFAEASRQYFGKDLSSLTLEESALLAGMIHAPNSNSPYKHPDRAKERRDLVLDMMVGTGAATRADADAAKQVPIRLAPPARDNSWLDAPYFSDYLQTYLEEVYDDEVPSSGRYTIYTSLDINLQRAATEVVNAQLAQLDTVFAKKVPPGTLQASLVAMDPKTGAVVAMVGGRNYEKSQFNRATDALRQPGSVFKPLVYAAALSSGRFTAASTLMDKPTTFTYANGAKYEPGNFGESYSNKAVTVRTALTHSKNVPTVELAIRTGLGSVSALAEKAGLPKPQTYPSMALGVAEATPLQIAEAYTAFANGGDAIEPTPIASTDGPGIRIPRPTTRNVVSPQVAYVMTSIMEDVVDKGTGAPVRARGFKGAAAGKTGTSRDGWFAGYTPNLVCVVWVGFDDNSQLGITGADSALPIWAEFMKKAVAYRPDYGGESFSRPAGLVQAKVCDESGGLATPQCPVTHDEIFVAGTEPSHECYIHSTIASLPPTVDNAAIDAMTLPDDTVQEPEINASGPEIIQPGTGQPSYRPETTQIEVPNDPPTAGDGGAYPPPLEPRGKRRATAGGDPNDGSTEPQPPNPTTAPTKPPKGKRIAPNAITVPDAPPPPPPGAL